MTKYLTVFVCGPTSASTGEVSVTDHVQFRAGAEVGLNETSADALNRLAGTADGECVTFLDSEAEVVPARVEQAASAFRGESGAAAGVVSLNGGSLLVETWRRYPPQLAALIPAADHRAAVLFRKSALQEVGPWADVRAPFREWLLRAVGMGHAVAVLDPSPSSGSLADLVVRGGHRSALVPEGAGRSEDWVRHHLDAVSPDDLLPKVVSREAALAVQAGLWQLSDFLEESHQLAQSVQGQASGDYWHGIMHRREPDYGNSKYWFRRTGAHPVFAKLGEEADVILQESPAGEADEWRERLGVPDRWDPFAFVDLCQHCARSGESALKAAAEQIQFTEMLLLLQQCYRDATGS